MADAAVEMAARGVALAAPLPNAISMYNITQRDLGWSWVASFAFALALEVVVFLLVEIALMQWDGYLSHPARYQAPFVGMVATVGIGVLVVMGFVYMLESHKIMAALPVISLCSFVGIGLKRWHEQNLVKGVKSVKSLVKSSEKPLQPALQLPVKSELTPRQVELLKLLSDLDGKPAEAVNKSELARQLKVSRPTLNKEFDILQSSGKVQLNGHVEISR
jgi:DNA-binding CsgD family transcriptional regulator